MISDEAPGRRQQCPHRGQLPAATADSFGLDENAEIWITGLAPAGISLQG